MPATSFANLKKVLACPNSNCDCSLGSNKGVYLAAREMFKSTQNQVINLTQSSSSKLSYDLNVDFSFLDDDVFESDTKENNDDTSQKQN